jgi:hypothetical protein
LLHLVSLAVVVQCTNPWSGDPPLFYQQWLQEVLFSALLSKLWVQLAVHGVSLGDWGSFWNDFHSTSPVTSTGCISVGSTT